MGGYECAVVSFQDLTKREQMAVETMVGIHEHYEGCLTGRNLRLDVMRRLIAKGIARSMGLVTVFDEDCCPTDPERQRPGFELTILGKALYMAESVRS